ncbi:MAG: hypothetical protein K5669_08580 [Lachnospiraceae bacterium]|nr:hypothetical protein [Lachnospiraceae bacterium]
MAMDIQTKMVIREEPVNNSVKTNSVRSGRADDASAERVRQVKEASEDALVKKNEERKARIDEQLKAATLDETKGKVISESKDGDTVRASEKSIEALNDGIVLQKKEEREITDLKSYTEDQLDILYREGKISRDDYDREVEKREELKEQISDDSAKKEAYEKAVAPKTETRNTAVSSDDDNKKAEEAEDSRQKALAADERNKSIREETESLKNFENNMNELIGEQMRQNMDPNLERFGTVEGFNVSITQ